jgi:hypothetical protein
LQQCLLIRRFICSDSASNIGPQATAKSDVQQQQQQQQQQLPPAGMTGASISREPQPPTSNFQSAPLPPQGYSQYPPLPPQGVPNSGLFANQIPGYGMPPAGVSPVPPQAGNSFEGGITRKADEESADVPGAKKPRTEGTPIAEEEWLAQHRVCPVISLINMKYMFRLNHSLRLPFFF